MTRVYVATTGEGLAILRDGGEVTGGERFTAADDSEEAEYAALMAAADASAERAAPDGRRVVVVAEATHEDAAVGRADVLAVHLDTTDRGPEADPDDDLEWFAATELDHL